MDNSRFLEHYTDSLMHKLSLAGMDEDVIDRDKVLEKCRKSFNDKTVKLINNVTGLDDSNASLMECTNEVLYSPKRPILTGYNTLFKNHDEQVNTPKNFLDFLKSARNISKSEMKAHVNDIDRTIHDNKDREQKTYKLIANSYYGAFGQNGFHFFNALLGPSVTAQGRQLISAAILGFEGFLGDNIYFYDMLEVSQFISNILGEEDLDISMDSPIEITPEVVLERIHSRIRFDLSEVEEEYLDAIVHNDLSQSQLQKLYYKNNFYEFLEIQDIKDVVKEYFIRDDFFDAGKPPEEIKEILGEVADLLRYFVGYPYPYNNKEKHASDMMRRVVLVCDTDSNFLHVYPWLQYVASLSDDVDIETIERNTRVSIISVITYFITVFIAEVFSIFCTNSNVNESEHHRINMKSEFHFLRVILTKNKKSYAGIILSQEGKVLEKPKFDIKGE